MNVLRILIDPGPGRGIPKEILSICPNEIRWVNDKPEHLKNCLEALKREVSKKIKPTDKLAWRWETWGIQTNSKEIPLEQFCQNVIKEVMTKQNEW